MQQPFHQGQQLKTRTAIMIFLKQAGPPMIFYTDNPKEDYEDIKNIIANASNSSPKIVERFGKGPIKQLAVLDTQLAGIALQEEQFMA